MAIFETTTRDRAFDLPDGSWMTVRARPPGPGWRIAVDGERWTRWTRYRANPDHFRFDPVRIPRNRRNRRKG